MLGCCVCDLLPWSSFVAAELRIWPTKKCIWGSHFLLALFWPCVLKLVSFFFFFLNCFVFIVWCMCVAHLTRSISTCCVPLPLLFAWLAWCCNWSSSSSVFFFDWYVKKAVFLTYFWWFCTFTVVFFFFSLEHFHFNVSVVQKKWRSSFFFLGFFGRILWHFQVFSVSFFISFFLACLCSLGLSQSRSDRRGCQSCLAGFSSSLQDMKTLRYKKCECEAALSCVCGSQKTFLMFLCFASGIFTGCTCFALDGRRSVKNNSHIFEPPRVRSRGPVACLRTSIVGDERQEGVWQMANKMKRFL